MVSRSSDAVSKLKRGLGDPSTEVIGTLSAKLNQLKKQIQAERVLKIKENFESNVKKLQSHVSQTVLPNVIKDEESGFQLLSSRIKNPVCKFSGIAQGAGDKDYIQGHEVLSSPSTKLPYMEKIPPYTTWIFLDKNQRMAEDQSVVGRRRIYYDQCGSEALICSDSEEEITEPEEEKHEFSESEDRILWMAFEDHGMSEDIVNFVSQSVGGTNLEIQERYNALKVKYAERHDKEGPRETESEKRLFLERSLSAALDSFDNLFCRRCLVFDCRLHGCSQGVINPCEKQSSGSELDEDGKPCSDQCYLQSKPLKELLESPDLNSPQTTEMEISEEKKVNPAPICSDKQIGGQNVNNVEYSRDIIDKASSDASETTSGFSTGDKGLDLDTSVTNVTQSESAGKRKVLTDINTVLENSPFISDDIWSSSSKKQKNLVTSDVAPISVDGSSDDNQTNQEDKATIQSPEKKQECNSLDRQNQLSNDSKWRPIEKELYLKGVEIFGRNSCLIARNMLSGLKTCKEVSSYMYGETAVPKRSVVASLFSQECGKTDMDPMEQEIPPRSRLFRKRGRTRKLKYSWKSAGHPSFWKRIADGKGQSCTQYTPCGCQSMCGKECTCLENGTCCEKYCGCSKSCKNRFRGCHCAKSQCRSRQCPCFAAGRECDPDVCRNCWVSCGDGSLGEPPKRGDGQCGNMRLLLRQQQKVLLAKSDVAGWGAFIKNSVNKNDYLGEYTGELISHREADKRGKIYDRANSSFLFDLNDQYVLDAYRKGDKLKFANHSSNPNCYAKVMLVAGDHRVGIFAKEHIEASEELFYDYRYGPDQAPAWARKPEGSKRDESTISQGRAKKHQSH